MDPILGQIILFAGNFVPQGWYACNGQTLPISQNTALFSLLGTMYGGDGQSTFALPDLRGAVPISAGQAASGTVYQVGQKGGTETVALSALQMPVHNHPATGAVSGNVSFTLPAVNTAGTLSVTASAGTTNTPSATNVPASVPAIALSATSSKPVNAYGTADAVTKWPLTVASTYAGGSTVNTPISGASATVTIGNAGGSAAHENRPPFLVLTYIIAWQGIYPSRP